MTLDDKKFNEAIAKLMRDMPSKIGQGGNTVLDQEIGLLVKNCVKVTHPTKSAPFKESFPVQKKAGMNAIKYDILKKFKPLPKMNNPKLRKIMKYYSKEGLFGSQTPNSLSKWLNQLGFLNETIIEELNPSFVNMYRNKRGRIKGNSNLPIYVVKKASINKTIKQKQKKVGFAKSGWTKAIKKFKPKGIPSWIIGKGAKGFAKVTLFKPLGWEVVIGNKVKYAQKWRIMPRALKASTRNLLKKIEILVKKAAKKSGF